MRQSRLMSLVEAVANVVVGYGVAVLTQVTVFPVVWASDEHEREPGDRGHLHGGLADPKLCATKGIRCDPCWSAGLPQGGMT
jgi:hypothetical protein